jgi:2-methylcitrate dehydratase PrpD
MTLMTAPLAERLAEWVLSLSYSDIPAEVVQAVRAHTLDALGVAIAASASPEAARRPGAFRAGTDSTVIGHPERRSAADAALLNGMLIHSLEYDDTHIPSVIHGSAVVVPAAMAVGERAGASGEDVIAAIVIGWELLIRFGLASPGGFQAAGFQVTAVAGSFAASAIAARLLGLSPVELTNALGINGSQASGTFEAVASGASVKAMHPGWAAHAGIIAADLARCGVTGPATVLEGRFGLFNAYAHDGDAGDRLADLLGDFGQMWYSPEAAFKLYPCCHYIHTFLECAQSLVADGLRLDEIERVECRVPPEEAPIICDPWEAKQRPTTAYQARFSLPFCLAAVLRHGRLTEDLLAASIDDPDVLRLAARISWLPWVDSGFPGRYPAAVTVHKACGEATSAEVADVLGSPARPASLEAVMNKLRGNIQGKLSERQIARLIDAAMGMSTAEQLRELTELLRV